MTGSELAVKRYSDGRPVIRHEAISRRAGVKLSRVCDFELGRGIDQWEIDAIEQAVEEILAERRGVAAVA